MAPNSGHGYRHSAERNRSQSFNRSVQRWSQRDSQIGQFLNINADGSLFKGVRRGH